LCLDGEQLRSLHNPLKARYRAEPAALAVRHAEDGLGSEEVSCSVQTGQTVTAAGLHTASGGDAGLAPGDVLFQPLTAWG
jgi:hypothetical protein